MEKKETVIRIQEMMEADSIRFFVRKNFAGSVAVHPYKKIGREKYGTKKIVRQKK
jgi:hypothetical protein